MINREFLNANHAAIVAEILAEGSKAGRAEGLAAGAEAERARIQAVEAASLPGCEQLVATLKYDGKTTGPEAAAQFNAHFKTQNAGALEAMRTAAPKPAPAAPSATGDVVNEEAAAEAALPIDERAKKQFDRDPKIRAEFGTVERYTGWLKHEAALQAA